MALAMREFWQRAVAGGLVSRDRARQLHDEFRRSPAARDDRADDALTLARWLVAQGVLDRDQAHSLLSGHAPSEPSGERSSLVELPAESDAPWQPPPVRVAVPRKRGPELGLAAGVLVAVALVMAGVAVSRWNQPAADGPAATSTPSAQPASSPTSSPQTVVGDVPADGNKVPSNSDSPPAASTTMLVDDDGRTLWASPTQGAPLSLDFLPSGVQVLVVARLRELGELEEGQRVLEALGPDAQRALGNAERVLGLERSQIERLWIAVVPEDSGAPRVALVAETREAITAEVLLERWNRPRAAELAGKAYYVGRDWTYYLPGDRNHRLLVVAPLELVKEVVERTGPPIVRRGIENLLRHSDGARHVTLVFSPAYLATDGQTLLAGDLARLGDPLGQFLDARTEAVMASAHLGDALFVELRATGPVEVKPDQASQQLAAALARAADALERQLATQQPAAYGRMVVNRFPRMVQLLADYTRTGAEDRQAVLRAYLPLAAAHNLTLAAQLWLAEPEGPTAPTAAAPRAASGVAAALARRVSLAFPRDTLEHSLELLAKEIDVEIVILGSDLQLEGITKNQSFGLELHDRPAGEVLGEILRLANPDGKLVSVVRPQGKGEAIFITTRNAAAKRGESPPAEAAPAEK